MEDSVHLRSIFIGASLFLILTIFSMVMSYYTKAKEEAGKTVNMEIETVYQANIESAISAAITQNSSLDAIQVKNMINYYYGSYKVLINLKEVKLLNENSKLELQNANNCSNDIISKADFNNDKYKRVNFNIDPNQKFNLTINKLNGVTTYNLGGK